MVQKKALLWAYGCILILAQCQNLSQDKRSIEELSAAIRLDPQNARVVAVQSLLDTSG